RESASVEAAMAALRREPRFLEAVASSSPPVARDLVEGRDGAGSARPMNDEDASPPGLRPGAGPVT
ncbi:hypothetical protein ACLESD_51730, partial [Pyxidicoccus sp. 3LFB2]